MTTTRTTKLTFTHSANHTERFHQLYVDSGATLHMTDHRKILWNFKPYDSTPWYVIGIGSKHFITVGQRYVKDMIDGAEVLITMKNVLSQALVLKFGINLFYIKALPTKE